MDKASVAFRVHFLDIMYVRSIKTRLLVALHIAGFFTPRDRIPLGVPMSGYSLCRNIIICNCVVEMTVAAKDNKFSYRILLGSSTFLGWDGMP